MERSPETIDIDSFAFPVGDDGRRFDKKWYFKILQNGDLVKRHWMLYSETKNALFCFPCLLFRKSMTSTLFSDLHNGFSDWKI